MAACKLGTGGCYYMLFLLTSDTTKRVSCLKKVPQCPSLVLSPQYCTLPLFIYVLLILKVICLIQSIFNPHPLPPKIMHWWISTIIFYWSQEFTSFNYFSTVSIIIASWVATHQFKSWSPWTIWSQPSLWSITGHRSNIIAT